MLRDTIISVIILGLCLLIGRKVFRNDPGRMFFPFLIPFLLVAGIVKKIATFLKRRKNSNA